MRLAFIGGWGHRYLWSLLTGESSPVTAVAVAGDGHDNARARMVADDISAKPGAQWFDDARTMLDKFKPDVVNVGAVFGHNGDLAALALERGVPVVCEKPIAATWEQLARLRGLTAGDKRRRIISEFPLRSHPAMRAARAAVADGKLGRVVLATAQKSYKFGNRRPGWYASRADYGSTVLWVASHGIDLASFVTGLKYESVWGQAGNISKPDFGTMEEYTVNVLAFRGGGSAVVHADYNRPAQAPTHGDDRLRVVGEKGQVEIRDERCVLTTQDQGPSDITGSAAVGPVHEEMLDAALGEDESIYSTAASLEMAAVLLAARDATDQGNRVTIADS